MALEDYHFFLGNRVRHYILGNDDYRTNEHRVSLDGATRASGEIFGFSEITRQDYERHRLPVMDTETNLVEGPNGDEAVNWLWKEWANVLRVRNDGVPTVGFTWHSLTDQTDWGTALHGPAFVHDPRDHHRSTRRGQAGILVDVHPGAPTKWVCRNPSFVQTDPR